LTQNILTYVGFVYNMAESGLCRPICIHVIKLLLDIILRTAGSCDCCRVKAVIR